MTRLNHSYEMFQGKAPWIKSGKSALNLASGIVSELSSLTLTEFSIDYVYSPRDIRIKKAFEGFEKRIRQSVEAACATGAVMFKPCFDGTSLGIETFLPFNFVPLGYDGNGNIDECAFIYRASVGGKKYVRIEEHTKNGRKYVITNNAYTDEGTLFPCPLNVISQWKNIVPYCEIEGLNGPLFSYFGIPGSNFGEESGLFGVPVFRRAEELIKEADKQFERLIWEFEGGELAIDASEDAFRSGKDGKPCLPIGKERLYRTNALDACCSSNELLKVFSPALRDESLINGLNRIIMLIEDACGIARGTFSDPTEEAKTATEVKASKQRTYATVRSIRNALKNAIYELIKAVNSLLRLYGLSYKDITALISMGDGVLNDEESVKQSQREDVRLGIITAEEFKSRWYGKVGG
jgi:A118 family predicted phage portal protein